MSASKSDHLERGTAEFFSSLTSHFQSAAAEANLKIDDTRISIFAEQGLLVATCGAHGAPATESGRDVGILHCSTPRSMPLKLAKEDMPPGTYVIHVANNGSVSLKASGGHLTIPASPANVLAMQQTNNGPYYCSGSYRVSVQYRNCQICVTLECSGIWVLLLFCISIPFCSLVTGIFGK